MVVLDFIYICFILTKVIHFILRELYYTSYHTVNSSEISDLIVKILEFQLSKREPYSLLHFEAEVVAIP